MDIRPLRRYDPPHLPTRDVVNQHPEILRMLPKRWQANPAVLTAIAGATILLQCGKSVLAENPPRLAGVPLPPTAALSEVEARKVIIAEAKKSGVVFERTQKTVEIATNALGKAPANAKAAPAKVRLTLDGFDTKHAVAFEYVSETDRQSVSKSLGRPVTSESIAAAIKAKAHQQLKDRVLVVSEVKRHAPSQKDLEEDVRLKVQEFVKWLKAQGVI